MIRWNPDRRPNGRPEAAAFLRRTVLRRARWVAAPVLAFACLLAGLLMRPALAMDAAEAEVKAAMVFNIARFTQWPAGSLGPPEAPFVICVSGRDDTALAIESLEGKSLHGHPVKVLAFEHQSAFAECRLLFVSRGESHRLNPLMALLSASPRPVLSISDSRDFTRRGGMVRLVRVDERVRFEINPREVEAKGLSMSSRLMSLAIIVK